MIFLKQGEGIGMKRRVLVTSAGGVSSVNFPLGKGYYSMTNETEGA